MRNLREQAGQLLILGFEGWEWNPALENLLRQVRPGGVIFFQRNISTPQEFQNLVRQVRNLAATPPIPPPFLALDLEGGLVDRLREALAPLPSARDAAQAGLGRQLGQMAGRELAAFSLNVDFAPVLDLATPESQEILASRAAGDSPKQVIHFAEEFLTGLAEQGILGCGKHFPGLGSGRRDSHQELPCIEKEGLEMWSQDLLPFRALASRLPMIMVAHAWYPRLEESLAPAAENPIQPRPASLSPELVSGLLKGRTGFAGLVLCDDLEMGGVLAGRSLEEAAVGALRAGCDMLLVCREADHVRRVHEAMLQEARRDADFRATIEQAARKVVETKHKLGVTGMQGGEVFCDWEGLRREIIGLAEGVQRRLSSLSGPSFTGHS